MSALEGARPNVDELLRAAIEQKRLIELIYLEKRRIVEPHDYGVHNGLVKLLGYQVGGSSSGLSSARTRSESFENSALRFQSTVESRVA